MEYESTGSRAVRVWLWTKVVWHLLEIRASVLIAFYDRICPGRHFAEASMFVYVAMVLHVFNIGPPLDADGNPIHIEPKMTNGVVS